MIEIDVVGVGQCSLDFLGKVEAYPGLDQKAELETLHVEGGGPVATALVTLGRLGVKSTFIGAVGSDEHGEAIRQGLLAEGVDTRYLQIQPDTSSQQAFVVIDSDGHRNIFWHRGTATPVVPDNFAGLLSTGVKALHLDGLHLESSLQAAQTSRKYNIPVVLDAGTYRPGIEELLPFVDHLIVSQNFAHGFSKAECHVDYFIQLGVFGAEVVVVTCGAEGCYFQERGKDLFHLPAFSVKAVDTTGCGDVFHGGYIFALLQDYTVAERIRFASACAALKTRKLGGRSGIPRLSDVNRYLAENMNSDNMQSIRLT